MRVAVVGLGNAGLTLHLPALAEISSVKTVGSCDLDDAQRRLAQERFGIPVFGDFDEMLEMRPDVVIVGTPPATHAEYCLRSLAAGAHVICEKPFAASVAEAESVIAAAARAGRSVALNQQFREMPIFRAILDQIGGPGIGAPVFVQLWQLLDLPPWKERGWRAEAPLRSFYEGGIHLLDYVMALFGEEPVAVTAAVSSCGARESSSDAVTLVWLEFSRGRLAQIVQNRLCKGDTQFFEVRADCEEASLRASFGGRARLSAGMLRSTTPHIRLEYGTSGVAWLERGHRRTQLCRNPKNPAMSATKVLFEKTLQAFRDGTQPPVSAEDGRAALEVLAACYRSAETGSRVMLRSGARNDLSNVMLAGSD